jgi:hypothetical protein
MNATSEGDRPLLEKGGELCPIVRRDLPVHVGEEPVVLRGVGGNLLPDRVDGGVHERVEVGEQCREDSRTLGADDVAPFDALDGSGGHRGVILTAVVVLRQQCPRRKFVSAHEEEAARRL